MREFSLLLKIALKRIMSFKMQTITTILALSLCITIISGINMSGHFIHPLLIQSDLEPIISDINIGLPFYGENNNINIEQIREEIGKIQMIDFSLIKFLLSNERRIGDLIHHFWVDQTNRSQFFLPTAPDLGLNIVAFDNTDLTKYLQISGMQESIGDLIELNSSEIIISQELASSLNKSIGDNIFLHFASWNGTYIGSYLNSTGCVSLEIKSIIRLEAEPRLFSDLIQDPFIEQGSANHYNLLLLNKDYLLDAVEIFGNLVLDHFILSIVLNHEELVQKFNVTRDWSFLSKIETQIMDIIETNSNIQQSSLRILNNVLIKVKLLEKQINKLQETFYLLSVPIIFFIILSLLFVRKISLNSQIHDMGVWISRGIYVNSIKRSYYIEGIIIGVITGIISIIPVVGSTFLMTTLIGSQAFLNQINFLMSNILELFSFFIILSIGLSLFINILALRNVLNQELLKILTTETHELLSWFSHEPKRITPYFYLIILISGLWFLSKLLILSFSPQVVPQYLEILQIIITSLMILSPFVVLFLSFRIILNRRDLFVKISNKIFSCLIDENVRNLIFCDYLRRPKNFSIVVILTTLSFTMGIVPIVMAESTYNAGMEEVRQYVGSDIKITGTYGRLNSVNLSDFQQISSSISGYSPIVKLGMSQGLKMTINGTYTAYPNFDILAIEPTTYINTVQLKNYMTPNKIAVDLFHTLDQLNMSSIVPVNLYSENYYMFEFYKDIYTITADFTMNITVSGFYQILPGYKPLISQFPLEWIFNLNFIKERFNIPSTSMMSLLLKLDQNANQIQREEILAKIKSSFAECDVELVDDAIENFRSSPEGITIIIWDIVFYFTLITNLFGMGLIWYQMFQQRHYELIIYLSRGMSKNELTLMTIIPLISVNLLGAAFGGILSIYILTSFYNILLFRTSPVPISLDIPILKILFYLGLLICLYLVETIIITFWSKKKGFALLFHQLN